MRTSSLATKYADPNGKDMACMYFGQRVASSLTDFTDTPELKERFAKDPVDYLEYVKAVERELSSLFKVYIKGSPEMVMVNEVG